MCACEPSYVCASCRDSSRFDDVYAELREPDPVFAGGRQPTMSEPHSLFEAAHFEFRILELDQFLKSWVPYPQAHFGRGDGYQARQECVRLNSDYEPWGRKFMVQRRAISHWEGVTDA